MCLESAVDLNEWNALSDDEQVKSSKQLNPYENWALFKAVENKFYSAFGSQLGVEKVFCGICAGLGGVNAISVKIKSKQPQTKLPKSFLGFPVIKSYNTQVK
jgi:hypothetical protein